MDGLAAGMVLAGRYRLTRPAGGAVWHAMDETTAREVIVKSLITYPAGDQATWERARLALRVIAGLRHPGVADVYDCVQTAAPGQHSAACLVRELVPGPTLEERLAEGPLPAGEALGIAAAVSGILADVHRTGLAHGNVVPANVVLSPGGVRVTDVGLWVLRDRPAVDIFPSALSYAAPERAAGGPATPASDMYSLGVVFTACLTGIAAGGSAGVPPLADLPGDSATAGLASLWAACLTASPQDRPGAAHAAAMSRQLLAAARPERRAGPGPASPAADSPAEPVPPAAAPALRPGPLPPAPQPSQPAARDTAPQPSQPVQDTAPRPRRRGPRLRPPGRPGRPGIARRGGLVALGGAATGVTLAVMAVLGLVMSPAAAPGPAPAPARGTPTAALSSPHPGAASEAASSAPELTSPVTVAPATLSAAPSRAAVPPVTAINRLWRTVRHGAADGQIRPDVAVDFGNLIQPVRSRLLAGEPAQVGPFVTTMRSKVAARLSEGAITAGIARVMDAELTGLAASAGQG